jgi:hypothetical protein
MKIFLVRFSGFLILIQVLLVIGCSKPKKELPKILQAVPREANFVILIDTRVILELSKEVLQETLSQDVLHKIPSLELFTKALFKRSLGIDMDRLSRITFLGQLGTNEKMAAIVEGLDFSSLDRDILLENAASYGFPEQLYFTKIKGLGVVIAASEQMLSDVLNAYTNKERQIGKTEKGIRLARLCAENPGLNHARIYTLTGEISELEGLPFPVRAAGLFLHMKKGVSFAVITEPDRIRQAKEYLNSFLSKLKREGLASLGFEVEMDKGLAMVLNGLLEKPKFRSHNDLVSVSASGYLKPLLQRAVADTIGKQLVKETEAPPPSDPPKEQPKEKPVVEPAPPPP